MSDSLDWKMIKKAAEALGVTYANFHQWKSRGRIPPKWRIRIFRQTKGRVSLEALESADSEHAA